MSKRHFTLIGRAEKIDFPEAGIVDVPAKIDTGAYRSSVWASQIEEKDGTLYFTLFDKTSPYYNGYMYAADEYELVEVENSFGHKEERFSVYVKVRLAGRTVRTNFTLADRSVKTYPVLIGRKLIRGKYLVNVAQGNPIADEEKA